MPSWAAAWAYAGGTAGARDVLGAIASSAIGVAGTTFSITVAALTLASNQMGPRLLRNFTRDPSNQYALGALVATFAFALTALHSVHEADEGAFVPQLAVTAALLLAFACVLIWFLHHVATSINVMRVVALVHADLAGAVEALPRWRGGGDAEPRGDGGLPRGESALLAVRGAGYLRVLDEGKLASWAAERDAVLRLRVQPGDFVFPDAPLGEVWPATEREAAEETLRDAAALGDERSMEQDLEYAVRQLVEIALRALSPSLNDPFTAITVLDRLGAALCSLAERELADGRVCRAGRVRVARPSTDYAGLLDAMFHMLRESGAGQPAAMIPLLDVLAGVASVERGPARRREIRRHVELAAEVALRGTPDGAAKPDTARWRRSLNGSSGGQGAPPNTRLILRPFGRGPRARRRRRGRAARRPRSVPPSRT